MNQQCNICVLCGQPLQMGHCHRSCLRQSTHARCCYYWGLIMPMPNFMQGISNWGPRWSLPALCRIPSTPPLSMAASSSLANVVATVTSQQSKLQIIKPLVMCSDLDDTMVGGAPEADQLTDAFRSIWQCSLQRVPCKLVYNTGASLQDFFLTVKTTYAGTSVSRACSPMQPR